MISNKGKITMKKMINPLPVLVLAGMVFYATAIIGPGIAFAEGVGDSIAELQHGWAKAYYQLPENQKETAFKDLSAKAHRGTTANPGRAEPMVWEAIILSSYAKFAGGLSAILFTL
jgi:hypothetical protein